MLELVEMKQITIEWLEWLLGIITAEENDDPEEVINDLVDREGEVKYLLKILKEKKRSKRK